MPLLTLPKWLKRKSARKGAERKKTRFRKCFLEVLEDRTLLTVNTYTVNVAGDAGLTSAGVSSGPTSGDLRYCIEQADNNAGSTIVFDTAATGKTITLSATQSELNIGVNTTITGPGAADLTISGGNIFRVFNIFSNTATVTISGLTIEDGNASPAIGQQNDQGGDIYNAGNLTLTDDTIESGTVVGTIGGPIGFGGGIFNASGNAGPGSGASLTLNGTTVSGNTAKGFGSGPGAMGEGGGIFNDTNATVILTGGSSVVGNMALGSTLNGGNGGNAEGGGVFNNGTLTLQGTSALPILFTGNEAVGGVGVTPVGTPGTPPTAAIGIHGGHGFNAGNGGVAEGGGIFNFSTGTVTAFSQATFSGDIAKGGAGGTGGNGGNGGNASAGTGGTGGTAGSGGFGGNASGGGVFNSGALMSIGLSTFTGDMALAGAAGAAGTGGTGGTGAGTFPGGKGGLAVIGQPGGNAVGGAVANLAGTLTVSDSTFSGDVATAGAGGAGGNGGNGGQGGRTGPGGSGANGSTGAVGGSAMGGGLFNSGGVFTLDGGSFATNSATSGPGGNGGNGGSGGPGGSNFGGIGPGGKGGNGVNAGIGAGGAVFNDGGSLTVGGTLGSTFTSNTVTVSRGGSGGVGMEASKGGNGDTGTIGFGGAIGVTASALSVSASVFGGPAAGAGNQVIGDAGGMGGDGFTGGTGGTGTTVFGGAIAVNNTTGTLVDNAQNLTLVGDTFLGNSIASGAGNTGGTGTAGGKGGQGGAGFGGAVSYDISAKSTNTAAHSISVSGSSFTTDTVTVGSGGPGVTLGAPGGNAALNSGGGGLSVSDVLNITTVNVSSSSFGGSTLSLGNKVTGGAGGAAATGALGGTGTSVLGGGIFTLNANLTVTGTPSTFNTLTAGIGGKGGVGSGPGGNGGNGGNAQGGGVFASNPFGNALTFSYSGASASNNVLTAANGGDGGNAGAAGNTDIVGGSGGIGGNAQGGGIFLHATGGSIASTVSDAVLDQNTLSAGLGGQGGAGSSATTGTLPGAFASGGAGGNADGGGLFNNSAGKQGISYSTLAGNLLTGGVGGQGGTGTTGNGGPGGSGGSGGSAEGGGFSDGGGNTLTVVNTTVGSSSSPNVLTAGIGGLGSDAGPNSKTPNNNGGNGGNGGSVEGGGVFVTAGPATFINDTIVSNQASVFGTGGVGGGASGTGTHAGTPGTAGVGEGGGYFADPTSTDTVGNTILDLNTAATGNDVFGTFTDDGNNIFGSTVGSTGLTASSDQTGVSVSALNIGPLLDNGGTAPDTQTDALLPGSVAIDAGNNALATGAGLVNDQRGPGFERIFNSTVDVGAFEFQPPTLNLLNPNTALKDGPSFTLTINGSAFEPGATVSFGGVTLTPSSITPTQIQVTVPSSDLANTGSVMVTVSNPDGSGLPGHTILSTNDEIFTITLPSVVPINPVANQNSNEGAVIISLPVTSPDSSATNWSISGQPPALKINASTGVISGTIGARAAGTYTVTVSAQDASTSGSTTFTWVVNDTTPPAFANVNNQSNNVGDTVNLAINATDADAGSFLATGLPPGLTINATTGVISGTVGPLASGVYTVKVSASDGTVSGSVSFSWAISDNPPALTNPGNQSSSAGESVNVPISSLNPDPGSFKIAGQPPGLTINATTGTISGTIASTDLGTYKVTVSATFGGIQDSINFNWVVTATSTQLINPGTQNSTTGQTVSLLLIPSSATPATGSFSASPLPPGLTFNANTGLISGTIAANGAGTYNVIASATFSGTKQTVAFTWFVTAAGSSGGGGSSGSSSSSGGATNVVLTSVTNTYPGFVQLETATVQVTGPNGQAVTTGNVSFSVDGQTLSAAVQSNGTASVTFAVPFLDFAIFFDLFFPHTLDAVYSDPNGVFGSSSASGAQSGILFDFVFSILNAEVRFLTGL